MTVSVYFTVCVCILERVCMLFSCCSHVCWLTTLRSVFSRELAPVWSRCALSWIKYRSWLAILLFSGLHSPCRPCKSVYYSHNTHALNNNIPDTQSNAITVYLWLALFYSLEASREWIDLGCVRVWVFSSSWPKRTLTLNCTMKLSVQVIKQSLWVSGIGECPSFMPTPSNAK